MSAKYPQRAIALGPPYDDGTVPGEAHPLADASLVERIRAVKADVESFAMSEDTDLRVAILHLEYAAKRVEMSAKRRVTGRDGN